MAEWRAIADTNAMAGMFQRFQFDITRCRQARRNALAVKVFPVDHPGKPDTQLECSARIAGTWAGRSCAMSP